MDMTWICGGDDRLSIGGALGVGRYSEVHEVCSRELHKDTLTQT